MEDIDATDVKGHTFMNKGGKYITGLDVFHQLHCLNEARKALDIGYYELEVQDTELHRIHVGMYPSEKIPK